MEDLLLRRIILLLEDLPKNNSEIDSSRAKDEGLWLIARLSCKSMV